MVYWVSFNVLETLIKFKMSPFQFDYTYCVTKHFIKEKFQLTQQRQPKAQTSGLYIQMYK